MTREPIRAIPYVAIAPRLSADSREADELHKFCQGFFAVSPGVRDGAQGGHGSPASLED
jgi:hypothetical protein